MSTDSGNLVPNPQSITSDCAFTLKNSAVRCRKYRASIPASNGNVFAPLSTVIVNIPAGRRATFLDCQNTYIRYTVRNNDATANLQSMFTDNNGSCFINRLDLYAGSSQLETVQQYNMIYNHYLDFAYSESVKKGLSTMYGTDVTGARGGVIIPGGGGQKTFTMPVLSGTIGVGSDKYLPLGMLASDIRCEFTLEANATAVTAALLSANWSVISFEVICSIIELSDEGYAQVLSISPPSSPIYLHGISWRNYVSNIPAASSANSILIPARFASLKTLFFHFRPAANVTSLLKLSLSARSNPAIAAWNLRISGGLIPAKQCILEGTSNTGGYAEGAIMLQESFHSLASPDLAPGVSATIYNVRDAAAIALQGIIVMPNSDTAQAAGPPAVISTGGQAGFALGIELETFSNKADVIISGINTLADNVYFEYTGAGDNVASIMNAFAVYDQILVLQNGILTARY